jgi:hypothetical protein
LKDPHHIVRVLAMLWMEMNNSVGFMVYGLGLDGDEQPFQYLASASSPTQLHKNDMLHACRARVDGG